MGANTMGTVKIGPRPSGASSYVVQAAAPGVGEFSVEFASPSHGDTLREERGTSQVQAPGESGRPLPEREGVVHRLTERHAEALEDLARY